jgi:hypothetical protein
MIRSDWKKREKNISAYIIRVRSLKTPSSTTGMPLQTEQMARLRAAKGTMERLIRTDHNDGSQ